ncbi:MAG: ROK family transcriptional regulator [Actinomycetota bacterium]
MERPSQRSIGARGRGNGRNGHGSVLSPSRIGDVNRSRVLQALCDNGPLSRAELARMAGVPRATIGGIVRPLLESSLLEEGAPDRSVTKVGKPGRPLWFRSGAGLSAAVALHRDACEAALISARGEILEHTSVPMSDPADLRAVHRDINAALSGVLSGQPQLLGAGVAVPGACDTARGHIVGSSQIPSLTGHSLAGVLERRLESRVLIDNDSRAQALGEKWFGEGRGVGTFASIQTGHGLGVGLVLSGLVFRGDDGLTGEIGHTCIDPAGARCSCGLRGCWETIATLQWLRKEARRLKLPGAASLDAASLATLAADGSREARDLLDRYADNLAVGLANLVNLINPQRMILHGDAARGGPQFHERIVNKTRARVLENLRPSLDLVPSPLDQRATLLGAAGLVLSETFNLAT